MGQKLGQLIAYRELLYNLVLADLKSRYKGSLLGFVWSLLNPVLTLIILSFVFSRVLRIQVERYPVFLFCALLPWTFTAGAVSDATVSVVRAGGLVKKVYFPREVLPLGKVLTNLAHFLLTLIVLFGTLAYFRIPLGWAALFLPVIVLAQTVFLAGVALLVSGLNVNYRDVEHVVQVLLVAWFYFSPIVYPLQFVPQRLLAVFQLNPLASLVTAYRDVLLDARLPDAGLFLSGVGISLVILLIGSALFDRYEPTFAEDV